MKTIKILGTGCPNCLKLEANVKLALEKVWIEVSVEKITEIADIMSYGIMSTPWLVIDEKVVSSWKINEVDEIIKFLEDKSCCEDENCCFPKEKKCC